MAVLLKNDSQGDVTVELQGVVDESSQFPELQARASQRIIFECDQIVQITSYGVLLWMRFMQQMPSQQQFVFRQCPRHLIDAFNTVSGFLPAQSTVESFYLPYECDDCHHESKQLVIRGKDYIEAIDEKPKKLMFPNEMNCPQCRSSMMIGVWENIYFRFLERQSLDAKTS